MPPREEEKGSKVGKWRLDKAEVKQVGRLAGQGSRERGTEGKLGCCCGIIMPTSSDWSAYMT